MVLGRVPLNDTSAHGRGSTAQSGVNGTVVFTPNLAGVACYRIPAVVQSKKGVIVAFAEARHGSCGDGAVHSIAARRSLDGGVTWSAPQNAAGNSTYLVGNPSAVALANGLLMLIFVKHTAKCEGDCGVGNAFVTSDDDGVTWSSPQDISAMWGLASGSLPGPGTALQLQSGRIMVPSRASPGPNPFEAHPPPTSHLLQALSSQTTRVRVPLICPRSLGLRP